MFASSACRVTRAAVRGAARRTLASPAVASAAALDPPSVFDSVVKLTIIDPSGARRVIPAYVGSTLYDACDANGVDLGPASYGDPAPIFPEEKVRSSTWTEPLYGSGAGSGFDHVLLQGNHEGVKALDPPQSNELKQLNVYWDEDEVFPESRLASQVEINDKMDGMVVYVPDRIVDDIP